MRKKTPWFKARLITPVRVGLYEVSTKRPLLKGERESYEPIKVPEGVHLRFRHWNGQQWFLVRKDDFGKFSPAKAFGTGLYQFWRGLTEREYRRILSQLR